ncbi:hypothetical protein HMPREF0204_14551 [Chryseobacterium gleum ATCC 35910]|uniref:Uncharacterized protein n=1 Tax=Chryseobacterium gleum ATCC 35910 TaxID=525257 RepID=A0ABP2IQS1_CHRGE|nr:hypothetical protein HMPREF0204_14551 [Chryseobacterium gleum ATCC 35910]
MFFKCDNKGKNCRIKMMKQYSIVMFRLKPMECGIKDKRAKARFY